MNWLKNWLLQFYSGWVAVVVCWMFAMLATIVFITFSKLSDWELTLMALLFLAIVFFLSLVVFALLFVTRLGPETMIVDGDFRTLKVIEKTQYFWRWDPRIVGRILSYQQYYPYRLSMRLTPVTPNPKVRNLVYYLSLGFRGTPEATVALLRRFGNDAKAMRHVQSLLYHFNEDHSRDLGKLFDPTDPKQQEDFKALFLAYFEPRLRDTGITVVDTFFDDALNPAF